MKNNISYPILYKGSKKTADLLHYFTREYFPLHDIPFERVFRYAPLLYFVHSIIYSLDVVLEKELNALTKDSRSYLVNAYDRVKVLVTDLLKQEDCHNDVLQEDLEKIRKYGKLEYGLMTDDVAITDEIIAETAELRYHNIRLLHHLLISMLNKPYNKPMLDALWPAEVLIDLYTDLRQYHSDHINNSYNTYQMLVKLHREEAPERMRQLIAHYKRLYREKFTKVPIALQDRLNRFYITQDSFLVVDIPAPILEA